MEQKALLAPAAVLILWTGLMLLWFSYQRFSSVAKLPADRPPAKRGIRGVDFDHLLPDRAQWASHNYTHLLEQPTIFYAVVLILATTGGATGTAIMLAWAYVAIRIVHSIWQALVNKVSVRALLFVASSLCLIGLAIIAVVHTLS
jgi:uncharacterized MAPEG superfamily protein